VTAVATRVEPHAAAPARRRTARVLRALPYDWALVALFAGFPLWWALGVGQFIWPILAVPLAARLFLDGPLTIPRVFEAWLLFVVWVLVSYLGLPGGGFPFAYAWRLASYLAVTVAFLFVFSSSRRQLPAERVVTLLTVFWVVVVAGGWLGVVLPNGEFASLLERAFPAIGSNTFFRDLVHPRFAQVHDFLGYPVGRPTAPFVYTNDWGSNIGLLTPFAIVTALGEPSRRRRAVRWLLVASAIPMLVSLNRGLWLSLGIGLVFAAFRFASRGNPRVLRAVLAFVAVLTVLLTVTPLHSLVDQRLHTGHSDDGREILYAKSIDLTMQSPIIGHGGPRPVDGPRILPAIGTQGHLWLLFVAYGVVGAAFFLWFLFGSIWRLRHGPPISAWCQVALVIAVVQLPFYDMVPVSLFVITIVAALGLRELVAGDGAGTPA
jgi:hypothetical protein